MKSIRAIAVACATSTVLLVAGTAVAADDPGVIRVEMLVGEDATVSGGPIRNFMCDDGSLVKLEFLENAVVLKALRAGTTLCSFRDVASVRKVVRVVVRDPAAAPSAPAQPGDGK